MMDEFNILLFFLGVAAGTIILLPLWLRLRRKGITQAPSVEEFLALPEAEQRAYFESDSSVESPFVFLDEASARLTRLEAGFLRLERERAKQQIDSDEVVGSPE